MFKSRSAGEDNLIESGDSARDEALDKFSNAGVEGGSSNGGGGAAFLSGLIDQQDLTLELEMKEVLGVIQIQIQDPVHWSSFT